ncbi:hypothetical protein BJ165DRAFT_1358730, partial [Panaeolus papilionaceus]
MATIVPLPGRGATTAPRFTAARAREIRQYFAEVEFICQQASVTTDRDKIDAICRYADYSISDLWQSLPSFSAIPAKKLLPANYQVFKDAVIELYLEADTVDNKFSVNDLTQLIFQTRQSGIQSVADIAEYQRNFTHIASFLISKNCMSEIECQRRFVTGFQESLWTQVSIRLQVTHTAQHPDMPFTIKQVVDAASFVIRGHQHSNPFLPSMSVPFVPSFAPPPSQYPVAAVPLSSLGASPVKTEQDNSYIMARLDDMQKAIQALADSSRRGPPSNVRQGCNFCGRDHFIRGCELVTEYIRAGKCIRNQYGRIALPSGANIPAIGPSQLFKDRIDEWHRQNPNQLAVPQLMHTI